jgi:Zn-dependent metalloprotease
MKCKHYKLDGMKCLVENLIQKTPRNQYEQIVSLADLQNIKSTTGDMKLVYFNMIEDRDVAIKIADKAISTSKELRMKVEELTSEFKSTKNALGNTQNALLDVEDQLYVAKQFTEQENRERPKDIKQVIEEQDSIQLVDNHCLRWIQGLLLIIHFLSGMIELFRIPVMR